jgi:hypothetical protein
MSATKIGTQLKLYKSDIIYTITDFEISIGEHGSYEAYIIMKSKEGEEKNPIWMVLELIQRMQLYRPEQEELAKRYHAAIYQNKQSRLSGAKT